MSFSPLVLSGQWWDLGDITFQLSKFSQVHLDERRPSRKKEILCWGWKKPSKIWNKLSSVELEGGKGELRTVGSGMINSLASHGCAKQIVFPKTDVILLPWVVAVTGKCGNWFHFLNLYNPNPFRCKQSLLVTVQSYRFPPLSKLVPGQISVQSMHGLMLGGERGSFRPWSLLWLLTGLCCAGADLVCFLC